MKLILSRKGFDSGYGGYPSPIFPDGKMVSLPIPEAGSGIWYCDIQALGNSKYSELITGLCGDQIHMPGTGKVPVEKFECHLDPDIDRKVLDRSVGWRGIMGQAGAAQTHLENHNIGKGDIFLYFGWFRHVEPYNDEFRYSRLDRAGAHVLYGYMEVERVEKIGDSKPEEWMEYHPHIGGLKSRKANNTIYIGRETLSMNPQLLGYGVFTFSEKLKLTMDGESRSRWKLPSFFRDTTVSYHSNSSWKDGYFQSAMIGQEFVVSCTDKVVAWIQEIIDSGTRKDRAANTVCTAPEK